MNDPRKTSSEILQRIIESARRMGIELNESEAVQWMDAITAAQAEDDITFDERQGVFGHRISMLDFTPEDLGHFRRIGKLVEFRDIPGKVETALALSGSAAQSKIQRYPGDADYFERVNIIADDRESACQILADIMHKKVLDTSKGTTYQLIQVHMGNFPQDIVINGHIHKAGTSISWTVKEIEAKQIKAQTPTGETITIKWDEAAQDPGWCKLDWVVADPVHGTLVNASNMLDVTWESTDGEIVPLDGYLDSYFQEIYLDVESAPIFSKLAQHVSANALDNYVAQLENEVNKYLTKHINYGKAAKRMYNIFRLTGHYEEAAFIRELFDEPTTLLYQVWALMRTMDECSQPNSSIPIEDVQAQADRLILDVVTTLEGDKESEVVRYLLHLREGLEKQKSGQPMSGEIEAARAEVINMVNNFFYKKLIGLPKIKVYMESFKHSSTKDGN